VHLAPAAHLCDQFALNRILDLLPSDPKMTHREALATDTEIAPRPPVSVEGRLLAAIDNHAATQRWLARAFFLMAFGCGFTAIAAVTIENDPSGILCPSMVVAPLSLGLWRRFSMAASSAPTLLLIDGDADGTDVILLWLNRTESAVLSVLVPLLAAYFMGLVAIIATVFGN